jgi:N-acetylmuramoyl-L-alanine amidase
LNLRPGPRLIPALLIATALVAGPVSRLTSQTPAPPLLTILSKDGRRAIPLALINNQEFVAVDDLAATFQLAVLEDALGALTITYKGKTIVLTNQALASVAGRLVSLPAPAERAGRSWLVPVEFINRALAPVYDTKLELRKPSRLLIVGDVRVPRVTVRYDLVAPGARLTIDATPRAANTVTQDNDRLLIKFDADALDIDNPPVVPGQLNPQSLVVNVRPMDATTIGVDFGPRVAGFRATSLPVDTTMRLTIDVMATASEAAPTAPAVAGPAPPPDLPPSLGPPASAIQTIAIDPGHGGTDEGVTGPGGTKEKNLTLAIARRIKAAVEARLGIRVLLTRDVDQKLPLDDRTAVANNNKVDLFISLHANGSLRPGTAGATIYYSAFDPAAVSGPLAGVDRVPTFSGGTRDIELVAWDRAQTRHLDQSKAFAAILEERFHDRVARASPGVDRAPLGVLESANMPAVLVEMGFLTTADQEKQLNGNEFQNAFVQAITEAIIAFRDSLSGVPGGPELPGGSELPGGQGGGR